MTDTVKQFMDYMLGRSFSRYKTDNYLLPRFLNRKKPTKVYLSSELFTRFLSEENISTDKDRLDLGDIIILNQKPPGKGTDFGIDIHSHDLIGYDSGHYGLKSNQP